MRSFVCLFICILTVTVSLASTKKVKKTNSHKRDPVKTFKPSAPEFLSLSELWQSSKWQNQFVTMTDVNDVADKIPGSYPRWAKKLLDIGFGWTPGPNEKANLKCDTHSLRQVLASAKTAGDKLRIFTDAYQNCAPVESTTNSINVFKNISQRYSYLENPLYHRVTLHFPGAIKTKALFVFKDLKPRDLLIFRPGIFATIDDLIAEKYLLKIFFELSEFNMIVLESSSSTDHMHNNSKIYLGGVKEGYENLYLIDQLRKHPQFSPLIKNINMIGMSLGGNGVLFASYMNQINNYKFFNKTMLICPVVDMNKTFAKASEAVVNKYVMDLWVSRRFGPAFSKREGALQTSFFESLFSLKPRYIPSYYDLAKQDYYLDPKLYKNFYPLEYSGDFVKDLDFYKKMVQLPREFYYFATPRDELVDPQINYQYIKNKATGNEFIYLFPEGQHCSFAYTYNWDFLVALFLGMLE